jgi:hypothetical protein
MPASCPNTPACYRLLLSRRPRQRPAPPAGHPRHPAAAPAAGAAPARLDAEPWLDAGQMQRPQARRTPTAHWHAAQLLAADAGQPPPARLARRRLPAAAARRCRQSATGDAVRRRRPRPCCGGPPSPSSAAGRPPAGGRDNAAADFAARAGPAPASCVASGLAAGHRCRRAQGGAGRWPMARRWRSLGTGPDIAYPRQHTSACWTGLAPLGAVVSEHPPGTPDRCAAISLPQPDPGRAEPGHAGGGSGRASPAR